MNRRPLKIRAVCLLLICCLTQAAAFAHGDCQSDKASNPYPNPLTADTTEPATPEHGISRLGHCDDMATSSDKIERPAQTGDQNDNAQNCCDSSSAGCAMSQCYGGYSIAIASTVFQHGDPSCIWHTSNSVATPTCTANTPFRPPIFS